jgi:hypothetical protein
MKNLDLNAMGVTEMTRQEVLNTEGGNIVRWVVKLKTANLLKSSTRV